MPEEKKELTPEEAREAREARKAHLEKIATIAKDVVQVSTETRCPPEAVAIIMLLHGLNVQANFEGASLRTILIELFGEERIKRVPPGSRLVH